MGNTTGKKIGKGGKHTDRSEGKWMKLNSLVQILYHWQPIDFLLLKMSYNCYINVILDLVSAGTDIFTPLFDF